MIRQPRPLKPNDKIAIVAPGKKIPETGIEKALDIFEQWGLRVVLGQNLFAAHHQFAGTDKQRTADFQKMADDESIKAIFCVRGGYGTTRIMDDIDFSGLMKNPKWVIGFSDITALLSHLHNLSIESIHGIMPTLFGKRGTKQAVESLRKIVFGESIEYIVKPNVLNVKGKGKGRLVGGNLSLLCHLIGTDSDVDTRGKLLFIEDVDEYLYRLDRMMVQMKRAGKLENLTGLIIGHFSDSNDDKTVPFGKNAYEIISEHTEEFSYPICFGFPVGHEPNNFALPVSRKATLVVDKFGGVLSFSPLAV